MADNTVLNSGTGGDTIATDDLTTLNGGAVSGVKAQRVKVGFGSDAVFRDVDASNGLPVVGAFFQTTQPISGTVTANAGTGTMAVSLATAPTTPVTGTFFQTTQPVSGTVAISNMVSQGLTDTQLRLTPVPVSGTVTTGGLTDTQLRAAAVPVSGSFFQATQPVSGSFFQTTQPVSLATAPITPVTGTFWQATQPVSLATLPVTNAGTFAVQSAATLAAETTKVIGTVNIAVAQTLATVTTVGAVTAITNALPAGTNVIGAIAEQRASTLHVTATAAVNTAITATLPAPAAGLFHYITSVQLVKMYSVIGVASGAGVIITSTNLPGTPAWLTEQVAGVAGSAPLVIDYQPTTPLKCSVAATATTFVAPAQLQTIWRWNISYFTAA